MSENVTYLHFPPGSPMPGFVVARPYKAVVVIEAEVTNEWRNQVSDWLVATGCLYMMAWGHDCSAWDDSVDWAHLDMWNFGDAPEDQDVTTTWHDDEPLTEVFWFCKKCAQNDVVNLENTLILHIASDARQTEILSEFDAAG